MPETITIGEQKVEVIFFNMSSTDFRNATCKTAFFKNHTRQIVMYNEDLNTISSLQNFLVGK